MCHFLHYLSFFYVTGSKKREKEANRSIEIMSEGKKLGHYNVTKNYESSLMLLLQNCNFSVRVINMF